MTKLPESHIDLLDRPIVVMLATVMPDGGPQVTPVWASRHGNQIWVNSAVGRQKDQNMRRRPLATIAVTEPDNPYRWLEVRGRVVEIEVGQTAVDHIEALAQAYVGGPFNAENPAEERAIYKIEPTRVNVGS